MSEDDVQRQTFMAYVLNRYIEPDSDDPLWTLNAIVDEGWEAHGGDGPEARRMFALYSDEIWELARKRALSEYTTTLNYLNERKRRSGWRGSSFTDFAECVVGIATEQAARIIIMEAAGKAMMEVTP